MLLARVAVGEVTQDVLVPDELRPWQVSGQENGERLVGQVLVWHDEMATAELTDAERALARYRFEPLRHTRSTGLLSGHLWSYTRLENPSSHRREVQLEYVDHQLVNLDAYSRRLHDDAQPRFQPLASLAMDAPFYERLVPHHRLVVPVILEPGETRELLLQMRFPEKGFFFPSLRIWSPDNLRQAQLAELVLVSFLAGGLLLMALVSVTVGVATGERLFFAYSLYAVTKIALWWTMAGFTHQFLLSENYHWSYISITGALVIATGLWFARHFLQSNRYTPKLDYLLQSMMWLAVVLVVAAMFQLQAMAVILITLLLFMYPLVCLGGVLRWLQGVKEAGVFALAWAFLVAGLVAQALRDLGYVEHNFVNYYWPAVGSYTEMVVILIAMGMSLNRLRTEKDAAEQRYLIQLENTKTELEALVLERTRELEKAKAAAEQEALTDVLTGADNRRSFFRKASQLLERSRHRSASFSILVFDLDHFKVINDTHGHKVGDQALRLFAKTVQIEIRDTDIFGRLGGEEFALLLPGSNDAAMQTAERLRQVVERLRVIAGEAEIRFTTSVGVAHYRGERNIEDLIYKADVALYDAKEAGRNCVHLAD